MCKFNFKYFIGRGRKIKKPCFFNFKEQPMTNGLSEHVVVPEKKLLHFCYCTFPQTLLQ